MAAQSKMTIHDLLRLALPVGTAIVAGHKGAHRPITWVHVLNTRPPAFPLLQGGEVALLSLDALHLLSDKLTLVTLVRDLGDMDVAAIGVVGEIGQPAQTAADELGIPLLHLPDTTSLRSIESQIAQVLMGNPVSPETRGQDIREQLLQLSTENRGLQALTNALAQMVGKTIVVQDKRLHPLAIAGTLTKTPRWPAIEDALYDMNPLPALFRDRVEVAQASPDPVAIPLAQFGLRRLVAPIVAGKMGRGFLSLIFADDEAFDTFDVAFARHGAAVCALEMAKEKAIREAQKRVQGNVLEQFLGGMISEGEALLRLTRLGYQADHIYTTLYMGGLRDNNPTARQIEALCNEQSGALGYGALVQPYGSEVIVFCEGDENAARDLALAVQGRVLERYEQRDRDRDGTVCRRPAGVAGEFSASGGGFPHGAAVETPHAAGLPRDGCLSAAVAAGGIAGVGAILPRDAGRTDREYPAKRRVYRHAGRILRGTRQPDPHRQTAAHPPQHAAVPDGPHPRDQRARVGQSRNAAGGSSGAAHPADFVIYAIRRAVNDPAIPRKGHQY